MATYDVYITHSTVYQTTVEAESTDAALAAGLALDLSTVTPYTDKSISARPS